MSGSLAERCARIASRLTVLGVLACALATVAMQLEGVIAKNVALAHELSAARADIAALRVQRDRQTRTISRLSDPHGAIPEIHEKLHLIGAREDVYYVREKAEPAARADERGSTR